MCKSQLKKTGKKMLVSWKGQTQIFCKPFLIRINANVI